MAGPPQRIIHTELGNGAAVCIRAIEPGDEQRMRDGIARMSLQSRYLRFFTGLRVPPDTVIAQLLSPDGYRHIAWGAIDMSREERPAVGAVHAYRDEEAEECAEFSVAIVDDYHGLGLGKLLTATILLDAAERGLGEFQAITLAENAQAIGFVRAIGGKLARREGFTLEYHLPVEPAIEALRSACDPPGIARVFAAFSKG